jgi:PAS domain S-box-containing protein
MISVLYVDDEADLLEIGKLYLERSGTLSIDTVTSAHRAINRLKEKSYDAIVSDYHMPVMDGIAFLKYLRPVYSGIPFILFTGKGREEIVIEALNNGADFYLQKGGDPKSQFVELEHKIRQAVSRRRSEEKIHYYNRLYTILSGVNAAIVRTKDRNELFSEVCRIAVEKGMFRMAWIGLVDPAEERLYPAACSGIERSFLPSVRISGKDVPGCPEPGRRAVREKQHIVCNDLDINPLPSPGLAETENRGYRSTGAFPIFLYNQVIGILQLYAAEPHFFSEEEIALLDEIASDISFALETLEAEKLRNETVQALSLKNEELSAANEQIRATEEMVRHHLDEIAAAQNLLRESEERFRAIFTSQQHGILIIDPSDNRIVDVNPYVCSLIGLSREMIIGRVCHTFICPAEVGACPVTDQGLLVDNTERVLVSAHGCRIPVLKTVSRVSYAGRQYLIESIQDNTLRKKAEDELMQKATDLEAAYEEITATEEELRSSFDNRALMQDSLKESEGRLSTIIDFLPDASLVIDAKGTVISWNRAMETLTGIPASAMLGKGSGEYALAIYGERRPILVDLVLRFTDQDAARYPGLRKEGDRLISQVFIPNLNNRKGAFCWFIAAPIYDSTGRVAGAIESIRDISELKKTEETLQQKATDLESAYEEITATEEELRSSFDTLALMQNSLKESEGRLAAIIDFLPDASFAIDVQGTIIAWNRAMEKMTGSSASAMLGKGSGEYSVAIYGERRPILVDLVLNYSEENAARYPDLRKEGDRLFSQVFIPNLNNRKGAFCWFIAAPIYDSAGRVAGAIESIRDISEIKRTEEALQQKNADLEAANEEIIATAEELRASNAELEGNRRILAENEDDYRAVLDSIQDVYYRSDTRGTLILASPSLATLLGYESLDECLGQGIAETFYNEPGTRWAFLEAVRQKGYVNDYEVTLRHKDGGPVQVSTNSHLYFGKDGSCAGVEGIFRDITERKRGEIYRQLSADVLTILNEHAELKEMICRILDAIKLATRADAVGIRLMADDDFPYFVQNGFSNDFLLKENSLVARDKDGGICRDSKGGISLECTCGLVLSGKTDPGNPLFTPGGSFWTNNSLPLLTLPETDDPRFQPRNTCIHEGYASVALIPLRTSKQQIIGILQMNAFRKDCFTPDIIQTFELIAGHIGEALLVRKAEEALRESEVRLSEIITHLPDATLVINSAGEVIAWNRAMEEMTGVSGDEMIGRGDHAYSVPFYGEPRGQLLDLIDKDDQELKAKYQFVERKGNTLYAEAFAPELYGKTGAHLWATGSPLFDMRGNRIGAIESIRDITGRKNTENALRHTNRQLNLLSAITRHDILNKVNVILGNLSIARKRSRDPDTGILIEKLSGAARSIREEIEFTRVYQDLGSHGPAWNDVSTIIPHSQVPSHILFEADVEDLEVYADPMLGKVFVNLVDNTLRHAGEVSAIRVTCSRDKTGAVIVYEDNGTGIPTEEKEYIFERGYGKNTGLGLFLAREILAITGISIAETGKPGTGARFELHVPEGRFRFRVPEEVSS